jgi:hypothetical protein
MIRSMGNEEGNRGELNTVPAVAWVASFVVCGVGDAMLERAQRRAAFEHVRRHLGVLRASGVQGDCSAQVELTLRGPKSEEGVMNFGLGTIVSWHGY